MLRVTVPGLLALLIAGAHSLAAAEPSPEPLMVAPVLTETPLPPPKPQPGEALQAYLANAFSPYEPLYFLADPDPLNAKFQFSFAVMLIGRAVKPEGTSERRNGLYFSYTQVSFWDLTSDSKPFFDSNYRPEGWWHQGGLPAGWLGTDNFDVEGGFGHQSNGQSGELSRSLNFLFIRPGVRWDLANDWQIHLAPQVNYLVGDLRENPDIGRYRGIFALKFDIMKYSGFKFATTTHIGTSHDRGAFQLDVSYPMTELTNGWVNCFVYTQWFTGWAESLRAYDERTNRVMFGIGFIR